MIKKKGRKPKSYYENINKDISNNSPDDNPVNDISLCKQVKKRGRKPKGGQIIEEKTIIKTNITISNVILHLKCNTKDINDNQNFIKYTPNINVVDNYNINDTNLQYNFIKNNIDNNSECENENENENENESIDNYNTYNNYNNIIDNNNISYITTINSKNNNNNSNININTNTNNNSNTNKEKDNTINSNINIIQRKIIDKKLKELSYNLKTLNISDKSACFWCTCPFDNNPIYIPRNYIDNKYNCYGCFCSPECASAYLMNESIDSSTKFERYSLLNNVYGKIYNYDKNIKPAPSPYYLLSKFYGNLDIQEYRKLLEYERLLLVIDKPLSKFVPDIYEENEDFLINSRILSKQK